MNLQRLIQLEAQADAALAEFAAIDLGYKYDELGCSYDPKKTQYPSLYINKVSESVMDFPEEGKATIEYRLTGRNMREDNGKKTYGMTLEVLSFEPEAKAKADVKAKAAGKAVEMRSQVQSLQFDTRTRNGNGEFVAGDTGGADPVTMRQAYGQKPARNPLLVPGAAAAALTAGGLLGSKAGRVLVVKGAKGAARMVRATTAGLDRKASGKTGAMWPRMGSKAPKTKRAEGFGEVIVRTATKGKQAPRWPRDGD
jgi:hypothetical protein